MSQFRHSAQGLWFAGCLLASVAPAAEIRVVGSDLLGPRFVAALERFGRENETTVVVSLAGSRPSLERLRSGDADLALLALPPGEATPTEPLLARVIAYQPVVLVVPTKLPLTQLTLAQVRGIFAANSAENFARWSEVGVAGEARTRPIEIHTVEPAAALTLPLFRRLALNGAEIKPLARTASLTRVLEGVRASDNAIGLVPVVPGADDGLRALALAASVRESAHLPTRENLHDGHYPLRLPLYVCFRRDAAPRLLLLLRFLLSDEGAEVLSSANFQALPVTVRNQLLFELEGLP
jgi:ABC-type phosphate transport system substrate-binding protein